MRSVGSLGVLACLVLMCGCAPAGSAPQRELAVNTHDPGRVDCPDGRSPRPGLNNFGSYIGTWQTSHRRDLRVSTAYAIGSIPGRVVVGCSRNGFVVVEAIYPRNQSPTGQALRVALTDLPDDSTKVYEHRHVGCRTLQYQSRKLAQQLGADDNDGRVDITMESQTAMYNPASIYLILIDLNASLGKDRQAC